VSFWVKSSVIGLYSCALRNGDTIDRTYVKEFTTVGTGWEYVALTFPVDTTGTWDKSTGAGLEVLISLAGGSDWSQAPNAWSGTNDFITSTATQANALSADTNSFRLALFKIEAGSVATPFNCRSFAEEFAHCQRYYYKTYAADTSPAATSNTRPFYVRASGGVNIYHSIALPVIMRTVPTITLYSYVTGTSGKLRNVSSGADETATADGVEWGVQNITFSIAPSDLEVIACVFTADARL
jgi:hypothetical protein